jgi:hypothetical protein
MVFIWILSQNEAFVMMITIIIDSSYGNECFEDRKSSSGLYKQPLFISSISKFSHVRYLSIGNTSEIRELNKLREPFN